MKHRSTPFVFVLSLAFTLVTAPHATAAGKVFRAGAYAMDITPTNFPAIVNGGFFEHQAKGVTDPLHARCLVLDDGRTKLAIVVVDSCMVPRELCDEAKELARKATGIPTDRMLVSATHTHTAPAAMGCLGCAVDPVYAKALPALIAEGIARAAKNLAPARIGWTVTDNWEQTNCRRWIKRPDKIQEDPFGEKSVRAMMHPGYKNPDYIGPSGPIDPGLSLLAVQAIDGRPLALLANYSMHYFGAVAVSADYYGKFSEGIGKLIGARDGGPAFVGMMSQGTSGDSHWMDYSQAQKSITINEYSDAMMRAAAAAYPNIQYHDHVSLAMAETKLKLRRRVADESRLAWARKMVGEMGDRIPKSLPEVYAKEQLVIAAEPERELKLQALRIGELGITAIPDEVFAITGLKLKAQSPLQPTFNIELANGGEGYIPPPEQHKLGGYTTWAARTAALVPEAEPRIVETVLGLLEKVSGQKRRPVTDTNGPYAQAVLDAKPLAYWRLNEFVPPSAFDATGHGNTATYDWEHGVAFYLLGVGNGVGASSKPLLDTTAFSGPNQFNRAPHFAGGSLKADLKKLGTNYSVLFWLWNGLDPKVPVTLPNKRRGRADLGNGKGPEPEARTITGIALARGSERLGITGLRHDEAASSATPIGTNAEPGRLFFSASTEGAPLVGKTALQLKDWHQVALVRDGRQVAVFLDGKPEMAGEVSAVAGGSEIFLGGRVEDDFTLEGKVDEAAVFDRALKAEEVEQLYNAAEPHTFQRATTNAQTTTTKLSPASPPLSAEESLKKIHLPAGFQIELAAAEPVVLDPVAFDWDDRGRLWVVEMADYPLGMDGKGKPGGRVRILEDTNGDGRYDKSTLFAEGLSFPTGILLWRDGCLVTAAPDILFLKDSNGDGKADIHKKLFSGFFQGNQQLRINSLRWGLDGWVYCANGGANPNYGKETSITSGFTGEKIMLGSRDFRFKPDTGEADPLSGPSQFGRNRDAWGHWFGVQNSFPLWHYVLEDRYLRRNPHVAPPNPKVLLTESNPRIYAASPQEKRYHSFNQAGHYTSACAANIYLDTLMFGPGGPQNSFTCEPFHNLVQHLIVEDDGITFKVRRDAAEKLDFFASEDRWCRPVMTRTGPDGALWVADMYRYMIEHPDFLTPQGKEELMPFYRLGDDKGRIYRIYPNGKRPAPMKRMDKLSSAKLVALLNSSNGWLRDKAQMMLLWRGGKSATSALGNLASSGENPLSRLQALWTLESLGALKDSQLVAALLTDPSAGVRENAVRIAENHQDSAVVTAAAQLADDPDAKVRLQLACSLGEWKQSTAGEALVKLALKDGDNPITRGAVLSSVIPHLSTFAAKTRGDANFLEATLQTALGEKRDEIVLDLFYMMLARANENDPNTLHQIRTMLTLLRTKNTSLEAEAEKHSSDPRWAAAVEGKNKLLARMKAQLPEAAVADQAFYCSVLMCDAKEQAAAAATLGGLIAPSHHLQPLGEYVKLLARSGDARVPDFLIQDWSERTPAEREIILDALMGRVAWLPNLLARVRENQIARSSFDAQRQARLLKHPSENIRKLANETFATATNSTRQKVIEAFKPAISLTGNAANGKTVFGQTCAACHQLDGVGKPVGPDLRSVTAHPAEKLLSSILDPSADIQPGYAAYYCELKNDDELYGVIAGETGGSLTFKLADATTHTVLRDDIKSLRSSNLSLMPDGLEAGLTPQTLADLIAYLKVSK